MSERVILIGASTGGPGHLDKIFRALPAGFGVPIVVAQHINAQFLPTLCESLSMASPLRVQMAVEKEPLHSGGYMTHQSVNRFCGNCRGVVLDRSIPCGDHSPSVDELFLSALTLVQNRVEVLAALLTGIGQDGAQGLLALRQAGAQTLAESEKSAIVYGMPRAAMELGAVDRGLDIEEIIEVIKGFGR